MAARIFETRVKNEEMRNFKKVGVIAAKKIRRNGAKRWTGHLVRGDRRTGKKKRSRRQGGGGKKYLLEVKTSTENVEKGGGL